MIVPALALAVLTVLVVTVAGGFLLRLAGRVTVLVGLLGAVFGGGVLGLFIAAAGGLMLALGSTRRLDRRGVAPDHGSVGMPPAGGALSRVRRRRLDWWAEPELTRVAGS